MAIWDSPKQATVRVSDNLVVRSYGNSEAQAVEELRRYAGLERLAEWERQTGKALKVEPYSGKKRGVLIEYDRAVEAPKEASLEVRRKPSDTALPIPGKVAEDLEAQGVSVRGEGVTVRRTEQGLRIDVAPHARNVTININMAELSPTGKDASPGRRSEFDNALQKAQREANAYDRELGLSAPTPEKRGVAHSGPGLELKHVALYEALRAEARNETRSGWDVLDDPEERNGDAEARKEGRDEAVRILDGADRLGEDAERLREHIHQNAPKLFEEWRALPKERARELVGAVNLTLPADVGEEFGQWDGHGELQRLGMRKEQGRAVPPSLRPDLRTADGTATVTRSVRFEEQVRAFAAGQSPFPERLPAYLLRPAMAEAEGGEQRVRALENLEYYHPDMMRRWREVPEADRAALVEGIREQRQGRQREVPEAPEASQLGELHREVRADATMRQSVVQSDHREDVAEEQLSEAGGGRTRVEAPDPTIGKGVATQVAGMAPIPTAGAGPEWRGTITEALQEVRARHGDVAFASGDWQRHSRVRVYTARELTDTVERVRDLIEPEKNEVKAYTVKPDGTIHNVVTNRDEFVALSGQAFEVRPDLEARLEREKAQQATVRRDVERKGPPEISVGSS